jgi:hypothetical protein
VGGSCSAGCGGLEFWVLGASAAFYGRVYLRMVWGVEGLTYVPTWLYGLKVETQTLLES